MKTSVLLASVLLFAAHGNASWFGTEEKPEYENWDTQKLHYWLESNSISVPESWSKKDLQKLVALNWETHKPWTQDMYEAAKSKFEGIQASTFETWDESRLRNFLLEQGLVAPNGPREQLVLAAKKQYNAYTGAASSLTSRASAAASTAIYGDATYQASKSASSLSSVYSPSVTSLASEASQTASAAYVTASAFANRKLDDTKDYVYSTWDDNQLRTYLEDKGVIKTKSEATRDDLLSKMRGVYNSATDPVYNAWSDSYLKQWLVAHNIIKSDAQKKREEYIALMQKYYYGSQDKVWSTWSESESRAWLVKNGIIKPDAQISLERAQSLIAKNYYNAKDTAWSAWDDSSLKAWLVEHDYLLTEAQIKRDDLVKLMNEKYHDTHTKHADYLTWPDARLRAYLRTHGVDDTKFIGRPTLLQEVRVRWHQSHGKIEQLLAAIRDKVYAGVENAEAQLSYILDYLSGAKHHAHDKATEAKKYAADQAAEKAAAAESAAASLRKEAEKKKSEL